MEVLELLVRGRSNKEIGHRLGLTEAAVQSRLKGLFVKLGVKDRTEAAVSALRHGMVHLERRSAQSGLGARGLGDGCPREFRRCCVSTALGN
jgi:DNA-binding CsgD family transcriptional regulator